MALKDAVGLRRGKFSESGLSGLDREGRILLGFEVNVIH
jgi:hypothetical protein